MTTWLDLTSTTRVASNLEARLDARWFNVKSPAYGAIGNGVTSDTTPITNALTAAALVGGIVWFPPGTYIADVAIPDGVTIWGSGPKSTWIKGTITSVGSRTAYRDIKIGNTGVRLYWSANATDILFDHCWLFGGNGEALIYMNDNSITNVRFVDCELSGNTSGADCVIIVDRGYAARHMEDITFHRCWFHGNDRMNFECIIRQDGVIPVVTGYRNCSLYDCILDKAPGALVNEMNVSYDGGPLTDGSVRSSGYSTVRGCKITGGQTCLELAGPTDMLIEGNIIQTPSTGDILSMSQYYTATSEKHIARIIGNVFRGPGNVSLNGQGVAFIGNDVETAGALVLHGSSYSTVTGNVIEGTGAFSVSFEDASNNIFTANQIRGGSSQSVLFLYTDTVRNLIDGNYLDCPSGLPFDVHDGTKQDFGKNVYVYSGVTYDFERGEQNAILPYSTSITPDGASKYQIITVTNATPFTINAPPGGSAVTFEIFNNTALPMGAITWDAAYFKLAGAFVNPAAGKRRTISFYWNGSSVVETSRSAADI